MAMTIEDTKAFIEWCLLRGATSVKLSNACGDFDLAFAKRTAPLPLPPAALRDPYDDSGMTDAERAQAERERVLFASSV